MPPKKPTPPPHRIDSFPPKGSMHSRLVERWHTQPIKVLGVIATIVAILASIGPFLALSVNFFATSKELLEHKHSDAVKAAYAYANVLDLKQLTLRNRVNDCNVKRDAREPMSILERSACAQYDDEFRAATAQLAEARRAAADLTKEK